LVEELERRLTPASYVWTGGTSGNWSVGNNWAGGVAPSNGETGAMLSFGIVSGSVAMIDDIPNLSVDAIAFSASGYSLTGGTAAAILSLSGAAPSAISDSAGGNSIASANLSISLTGNAQISVATGTDVINAPISGGFGITKAGTGTLTLGGNSSFSGGTTISAGLVKIDGAGTATTSPLGTFGTVVGSNAALDLAGTNLAFAEPLTLSGTGISGGGALTNSSGTAATYTGLLTLATDSSIVSNAGNLILSNAGTIGGSGFNLTLDGTAAGSSLASIIGTGAGGVTKTGAGTWIVSGLNTFTGPVNLNGGVFSTATDNTNGTAQALGKGTAVNFNGGTLRFTNATGSALNWAPTLTFGASGGTLDFAGGFIFFGGVFAGTGQMTVINSTNATSAWLLYTAASPSYAGNIVIGNGVGNQAGIQYRSTLTKAFGTSIITVNTGGLLSSDGGSGGIVPNNITLNGGILGTQSVSTTYSGSIFLQSNSSIGSPPTGNSTAGAFVLSGAISGPGGLTKTTADTATLSGINTYTGNTTVAGGVLTLSSVETPGVSGPLGNQATNAAGTIVQTGGTIQLTATDHADYSGRLSTAGSQAWNFDTNGQSLTFATLLQGTGSSLTKAGAGVLTLPNAETYTGTTTVSAGSIDLQNAAALQSSVLTVNTANGVIFDQSVTGNAFTLGGLAGSANIALQNNASTPVPFALTLGGATNATYSGVLSSGTGVTKVGANIQVFSGANIYAGNTTITAGELGAGVAETAGTSGPFGVATSAGSILLTGGAIQYSAANKFDYSGRFSQAGGQNYSVDTNGQTVIWATALTGSSALTKSGAGILVLPTANTYTGNTSIAGGEIQADVAETPGVSGPFGDQTVSAAGTILMTGGGIQLTALNSTDYSGRFSTAGGQTWVIDTNGLPGPISINTPLQGANSVFIKAGAGVLTMNAADTYGGGTTVSGGTMLLNNTTALGAASAGVTVLATATLDLNGVSDANSNALTISGAGVSGAGALTNSSPSEVVYSGLLALGANASIISSAGSIILSNTGSINGTNATLTVDGTAIDSSLAGVVNTGSGAIIKNGSGNWTITGANNFTGGVTVNAGTFVTPLLNTLGNGQGMGKGSVLSLNGGTFRITNQAIFNPGGNGWSPTVTVGASGGTIDVAGGANAPVFFGGTFAGTGQLTVLNTANANSAWLLVTSASPSFTGNIVLGNGVGNQAGIQYRSTLTKPLGTGSITVNNGGLLSADGGNGGVVPNAITLNGGILGTQSVNTTYSGTITVESASQIGSPPNQQTPNSSAGSVLLSGTISGSGSLTKMTGDTVTFTGQNTYTGNTVIVGGIVNVGSAENAGVSGPLGDQATNAAGTVVMTGGTLQYSAANNFDYSGRLSTGGGQTWNIDTNGVNVTFASPLQGIGSTLTKLGTGTLFLTAANTFTGATTVSAGTLNLSNALALENSVLTGAAIFDQSVTGDAFTLGGLAGAAALPLLNNATTPAPIALTVGNTGVNSTYTGILSGTGSSVTKIGPNTQAFAGANTYSGGSTVVAGVLQIGNAASNGTIGTGNYVIQSGATLLLDYATAAAPVWANISGAGTLELESAQGANGQANWSSAAPPSLTTAFTGTLRLDNGRVNAVPANLGSASNVIINNGAQFLAFDGAGAGAPFTYPQNFTLNGLGWGEAGENAGALRDAGIAATFTGNITLSGNTGLFTQPGLSVPGTITTTGIISDNNSGFNVTINAFGGAITLAGADTYTGGTSVAAGTLDVDNSLALRNSTLTTGGTATVFDKSVAGDVFTVGGLAGAGNLALNNNATTPSPIVLIVGGNNASTTYTGVLSGAGSLVKVGSGMLTLSGANTYTGGTTVLSGTLLLGSSTVGNITSGPAGTGPVTLGDIFGSNSASIFVTGAFSVANPITVAAGTSGTLTLGSNAVAASAFTGPIALDNNLAISDGSGAALSLSGNIAPTAPGPETITFADSGAVISTGTISDGAGSVTIAQSGTGTTTLAGNDTYSGSTSVGAGTLFLNGSNTTSAINVVGSATFGGIGTASVAVATLQTGSTIDAGIGGVGTFGTLTLSGLTFSGSGTLNIGPLAGYTASAPLLVAGSGALTLSGGAGSVAIDIANVAGIPFNTPIKLLGYSGTIGGTGSSAFVLGPLPNRAVGAIHDTGSEIDLTITSTDGDDWTGAASNEWNTTAQNWVLNSTGNPTVYTDPGDSVTFDDRATTNTTILLDSQNVSPSNVSFNNSSDSYTLTGPFGIVGTTGLSKSGTGTTTLTIADSYSGVTSVNAGVLNIQNGTALGSTVAGTTVAAGAALQLQGGISVGAEPLSLSGTGIADDGALRNISGNNTFAGPISMGSATRINSDSGTLVLSNPTPLASTQNLFFGGAGTISLSPAIQTGASSVTKDGSGTLVLTAVDTYTGGTTISAGTLQLGNATVNGTIGTGPYSVAAGAKLYLDSATAAAVGTWTSTLLSGAGTLELNSAQPVNGTAQFGQNSAALANFSSAFTGTLQVDNGRIDSSPAGLGGVSNLVINSGAQFLAWSGTYNIPITIAGTGWGEAGQPGALRLAGGNNGTWTGPITLSANSEIMSQGSATFTLTGAITGAFNAQFDAQGGATLVVSPATSVQNSYASTTILDAGAVIAGNAFAFSTGPLALSGGTLKLNGNSFSFADLSGATGTLGDFSNSSASTLTVGSDNTSTSYGGTLINGGSSSLGLDKLGTGTLTLGGANTFSGPTVVSAGTLKAAVATVGGATPTSGAFGVNSAVTLNGGASVNLNGLNETLGSLADNAGSGGTVTSGTAGAITLTTGGNNASTSFAGMIQNGSGTVSVIKVGSGAWTLSGANTYTGTTTINGGALFADNTTGSATGTGPVVVSNSTFGGNGAVSSTILVENGSTLTPGVAGVGALGTGALTFQGGSTFAAAVSGSTNTSVNVNGDVNLGSSAVLNITIGTTPTVNGIFTLINNLGSDPVSGNFIAPGSGTPLANGSTFTVGATSFKIFYNGGDGNDVILIEATASNTTYVSNSNFGLAAPPIPGQTIDGDQGTPGTQAAIYGISAFSDVADGLANVSSAGTVVVNSGIYPETPNFSGSQTLSLSGGPVTLNSLSAGPSAVINLQANTLTVGDNVDAGVIAANFTADSGSLVKVGSDTLTLNGNESYTGGTTVSSGTLVVNSASDQSSMTFVASGATLGGSGTLSGSVSSLGTVSPSASGTPGTLTIAGALDLNPNTLTSPGTLSIDLVGGGVSDQVNVTGLANSVNLDGATLDLVTSGTIVPGASFTILTIPGTTGDRTGFFSNGSTITVDSQVFSINYAGGDGNDVVLTALSPTGLSVVSTVLNGGIAYVNSTIAAKQHSMVENVVYSFSQGVSLSTSNFALTGINGTTSAPNVALASNSDGTVWTVTFTGTGVNNATHSIGDGEYSLAMNMPGLTNTFDFFRLLGDMDGNGTVDSSDFNILISSFLRGTADPAYLGADDLDGNGKVDGSDFNIFVSNFLKKLPDTTLLH
jgi:fibronectin-binding autotransporter adhesin